MRSQPDFRKGEIQMSEPVIQLNGISKTFKNGRGVEQITLEVNKGDVYGFFGPNGGQNDRDENIGWPESGRPRQCAIVWI